MAAEFERTITEFKGKYAGFSNFSPHFVTLFGHQFPNGEAAFHALKNYDTAYWDALVNSTSPGEAKRLGRKVELRADWDEFRVHGMKMVVARKFTDHPDLLKLLFSTENATLIEGNNWHDQFWGNCTCSSHAGIPGQNMLGKTLMQFRDYWRTDG